MIIFPEQYVALYEAVKADAYQSEDRKVVVFVSALEADSVCAVRILQVGGGSGGRCGGCGAGGGAGGAARRARAIHRRLRRGAVDGRGVVPPSGARHRPPCRCRRRRAAERGRARPDGARTCRPPRLTAWGGRGRPPPGAAPRGRHGARAAHVARREGRRRAPHPPYSPSTPLSFSDAAPSRPRLLLHLPGVHLGRSQSRVRDAAGGRRGEKRGRERGGQRAGDGANDARGRPPVASSHPCRP